MEEEVRHILRTALSREPSAEDGDLGEAIQRRFKRLGGVKLALPKREAIRKPPALRR
jgi:hypothetical protein